MFVQVEKHETFIVLIIKRLIDNDKNYYLFINAICNRRLPFMLE